MLVSRGHSLKQLLEEYPMSVVTALGRAAQANRSYDMIGFSNAVAAGAVHAIEAGFSGKKPKALKNYQRAVMNGVKKMRAKGQGQKQDAETLFAGFGGMVEKRSGRRKDKS